MKIRKFIFSVFIIIILNFSFQPVNVIPKEKEAIVFIMELNKDKFTDDFIKKNETKMFFILVSLTMHCLLCGQCENYFNTS